MPRPDMSPDLVHWIKGNNDNDACDTLVLIASSRQLIGGTEFVKGSYPCVCFTETPITDFHVVAGRYRRFGIVVEKKWLYDQGGRPVIYQPDHEYYNLPDCQKWRHVRYEPNDIDLTWEREWRVQKKTLSLPLSCVDFIVPDDKWAFDFESRYERFEQEEQSYNSYIIDGELYPTNGHVRLPYRIITFN